MTVENIAEEKVKQVFGAVFDVDPTKVKLDWTPDTVKNWDSLRHMNFILALEEEFGMMFSDDEIVAMRNLAVVLDILGKKAT
jgi:acyl carrier protein